MPHYPLPIPDSVIKEVDDEERRWGGDKEISRRAKTRAAIQALYAPINAIYDSGTPLFTKAAITSLIQQIDQSGVHRVQTSPLSLNLSIPGIDGKTVDIPLQLGVPYPTHPAWPPREDGFVLMAAMLSISLRPADHLTSTAASDLLNFDPRTAFLTMIVEVLTVPISPTTGELVNDVPICSADAIRAMLQQEKTKWDAGPASRALAATFQRAADAGRLPHVDKVVAPGD
ncbi:hypothetical protein C8A05DRAFT_31505 [Staphylotrichum tortipilum]|uniref:Uncharacterized protein n=1 Tax=Staphylotrichum tortipilum TaxID=2831512 RepID=A0AAN6RWH1_9PEZI|nr:hypothetical protein C8A05DRAFT_31505 [Staphylotrichum longicolle]